MSREELLALVSAQAEIIEALTQRVAELERQVAADSSNSSRPPSSDAPWAKQPAKKRSSRTKSGRKPGKQPGTFSISRRLVDNPDDVRDITPKRCRRCEAPLADALGCRQDRRQVVDVGEVPPPRIVEYRRISKRCSCG